jgi:hypothetical protein
MSFAPAEVPSPPTHRGPVVHPTNADYQHEGSIHSDATASELGFRGGTIAGSAHLDTVASLAVDVFGERWWETGGVSMYFRHATIDGEPTFALFDEPEPVERSTNWQTFTDWQGVARVVTPDHVVVGEGSISIGNPSTPSELAARDLRHNRTESRLLSGIDRGDAISSTTRQIESRRVRQRCENGVITIPLNSYVHGSPWGAPIAPLSAIIDLVSDVVGVELLPRIGEAVGMWGALEVRFHGRPVPLDTDLVVSGVVAAVGSSPKTEILWYDTSIELSGQLIATARVLTRFVKASSPLWKS